MQNWDLDTEISCCPNWLACNNNLLFVRGPVLHYLTQDWISITLLIRITEEIGTWLACWPIPPFKIAKSRMLAENRYSNHKYRPENMIPTSAVAKICLFSASVRQPWGGMCTYHCHKNWIIVQYICCLLEIPRPYSQHNSQKGKSPEYGDDNDEHDSSPIVR